MPAGLRGVTTSHLCFLLQQFAIRKLHTANCSAATPGTLRGNLPFLQTKRFTQKEKKQRDAQQVNKAKQRKIEAKQRIPFLEIPKTIKVGKLAQISNRTPEQIYHMKSLVENVEFQKKKHYPLDVEISGPLLSKIVKQLGYRPLPIIEQTLSIQDNKDIYAQPVTDDPTKLHRRPPVVAVMGHVDHGKTTILDALRRTSVAANEAGGITQSIGAFSVPLANQTVTFLDTPGHSVFTSMRERGAKVTDIVVLVVAADDGVMEQTVESINMAKMAEATIVVALNKCDKKDAEPDLVIEDLDAHGIKCEQLGGSIPATKISALKNIGLDKLVESIVTKAASLDLKHDPDMQVQGFILESKMEKGRGNVASVIVKQGTLEVGKIIVAGTSFAKVKKMVDANGKSVEFVRAGEAASIMGWRTLPMAGQVALEADSEMKAKEAIRQREKELKYLKYDDILKEVQERRKVDRKEYEEIKAMHVGTKYRRIESFKLALEKNKLDSSVPHLNIIVKADVDGSMEAIQKILDSYDCYDDCHLNVVSTGVGELKLSEYELAKQLEASVFLFNTDVSIQVKRERGADSVNIYQYKVIYHLVNELREKLSAVLPPLDKHDVKGEAEVLEIFNKGKQLIAGCKITSGVLDIKDMFALVRKDHIIHEGSLASMRQRATVVSKMMAGNECGLVFSETPNDGFLPGDIIQCYTIIKEDRTIKWRPPGF